MSKTLKQQANKKRNRKKTVERNIEYIRSYKEYHKCCKCGEGRAVCLDLHHRDPTTKKFRFSDGQGRSIKTIDNEFKKCVVVCANCHRLIHAERRLEQLKIEEAQEKTLFSK